MRYILCSFYILLLSGCQSFIAYQITQPAQEVPFDGMENMVMFSGAAQHTCTKDKQCLHFRLFSQSDLNSYFSKESSLGLSLIVKSGNKTEEFSSQLDLNNQATPNSSSVIVLFPGYGLNSMGYSFQARWLSHFTGKDVIIMPASNQYNEFKFGLNNLDVLKHYLDNSQYQQIDILSYSMGCIAAMQLGKQMPNVKQQIMVAPMVHFDTALMSVTKSYYPTLSYFVKDDDFKTAAKNVIHDSGIDDSQLDLIALLNDRQPSVSTTLYVSNGDLISPADYWQALQNKSVSVVHYSDLDHTRMVSLINQAMRNEVLHRLM
ncbi:alpha/beta hydrolase [uncultured Pseudoalteromonas sp.]|uniref:alpha/beta hydrolase n=1 Tax=uncultured Pseudoalteromonas sp. TaxID=114053 RepID=UPI0032B2DA20